MQKIKHWLAGAVITIAGLFGYHATIPNTGIIEHQPPPIVQPISTPAPTPKPQEDRIKLECDDTCTDAEVAELKPIQEKLLETESDPCFPAFLLNQKNGLDPTQLNGLTPIQALNLVTTAKVSTKITYFEKPRNWWTKVIVVGFENGDGMIHANRLAWADYSLCDKVANVAHELSHGDPMYFEHDFENTSRRPFSMPYEIGSAIDACCKN